jgi:sRNA-binding protein
MYHIRHEPKAAEVMGSHIRIDDNTKFKGDVNHYKGYANLEFNIKGDKGVGKLKVDGRRVGNDEWDLRVLEIEKDGARVSLA